MGHIATIICEFPLLYMKKNSCQAVFTHFLPYPKVDELVKRQKPRHSRPRQILSRAGSLREPALLMDVVVSVFSDIPRGVVYLYRYGVSRGCALEEAFIDSTTG